MTELTDPEKDFGDHTRTDGCCHVVLVRRTYGDLGQDEEYS